MLCFMRTDLCVSSRPVLALKYTSLKYRGYSSHLVYLQASQYCSFYWYYLTGSCGLQYILYQMPGEEESVINTSLNIAVSLQNYCLEIQYLQIEDLISIADSVGIYFIFQGKISCKPTDDIRLDPMISNLCCTAQICNNHYSRDVGVVVVTHMNGTPTCKSAWWCWRECWYDGWQHPSITTTICAAKC